MIRNQIYNKIMLTMLTALLGITIVHAERIEITLSQPGTLPQMLSDAQLNTVTELILKGDINGTDVKRIRQTKVLKTLNLVDANVVSGGEIYYQNYQSRDNVIGAYMFCNANWNAPLTTCLLPRTVTTIGECAFSDTRLTEIHIPEGVKVMERGVFWGCTGLANVQLPSSLEILGDDVFNYCYPMERLQIPANVKQIDGNVTRHTNISILNVDSQNAYYASEDNVVFTKDKSKIIIYAPQKSDAYYTVPPTVKVIDAFAFYNTTRLKNITLNQGLEEIQYAAFSGSAITSIHFPESFQQIYHFTFTDSQLQTITVDENNNSLKAVDNVLYSKDGRKLLLYPPAKSGTEFIVPEGVVEVANSSIPSCKKLVSVEFPETLTSLDRFTFSSSNSSDSKNIKRIRFKSSTPPEIVMDDELAQIDYKVCALYVPAGCKEAYQSSRGWSKYTTIIEDASPGIVNVSLNTPGTLADSLKVAPGVVTELTVSGPLNGADVKLIRGMSKLILLNLTNASIVEGGGSYWDGEEFYTQNNIIGIHMFREMPSLVTLSIPKDVTRIEVYGFGGCSKLSNLTLPEGLISIGSLAFSWTNLSTVNFPTTLKRIDSSAFSDCKFTQVNLPPNLTSLFNPFESCYQLENIYIDPDNPYYYSENGILFNKNKTTLVIYPSGKKESYYSVPNGVTTISVSAFSGNNNLSKIELPGTVAYIQTAAIANCSNLRTINIPQSVKSIMGQAFQHCINLSSIELPEGLETLENSVFDNCRSLKTIRVPQNITGMPPYSLLNGCQSLTSLIWEPSFAIPQGIFGSNNIYVSQPMQRNCLIYVKEGVSVPAEWKNIIRNGVADEINLTVEKQPDGYAYQSDFYCPREFTARRITYSRDFTMESGRGDAGGWEGIVLPFTVQKFTHETKGKIAPFNSGVAGAKNFWLREQTPTGGFKAATTLEANKPYIISMPNHSSYDEEYRLNGTVLFEAGDVTVPATSAGRSAGSRYDLVPAFSLTSQSDSVYALNLYSEYDGQKAGSSFVRNLRSVNPFEVYAATNEQLYRAPRLYSIGGGDATGLKEEPAPDSDTAGLEVSSANGVLYLTSSVDRSLTLYTANGCALQTIELVAKETFWINDLPKGVYLLQNRKVVIR